jgi:hypothetical protein
MGYGGTHITGLCMRMEAACTASEALWRVGVRKAWE